MVGEKDKLGNSAPIRADKNNEKALSLQSEDKADEVEHFLEEMVDYFNGTKMMMTKEFATENDIQQEVPPHSLIVNGEDDIPF